MPERDASGGSRTAESGGVELSDPESPGSPPAPRARTRRRRRAVFLALGAAAIVAVAIWALLGSGLFVEQITQVQSAQVSRDWPDSVTIVIRERTPALAVASGGGFALIDSSGVVLGRVPRRPAGMVLLTAADPGSLRGSPAVGAAVTVLRQLPPSIRRLVRAVAAPSPDAVTLSLRGGITVVWGGTDRSAAKAAELEILMRTNASSYNLSDPNTAVTGG